MHKCYYSSYILFEFRYTGGTCQNPQGQRGTCISIRSCTVLLNLLKSNPQNRQVTNFLRASVCGYEGDDPWVCCPSDGGNTGDTNGLEGDRDRNEIKNTAYGPLYPPTCGLSNVTLRRIVGGQPASLGTNDFCIMEKFRVSYSFLDCLKILTSFSGQIYLSPSQKI